MRMQVLLYDIDHCDANTSKISNPLSFCSPREDVRWVWFARHGGVRVRHEPGDYHHSIVLSQTELRTFLKKKNEISVKYVKQRKRPDGGVPLEADGNYGHVLEHGPGRR